ncbi:MAG: primosomal protein N' [Anaerolineaceae bacterium]|nr:MAG: primosomal protein N' [Anaerolineales bacterium]GIK08933.1 MAG: primosomal protein N' [Chloroflexota bacterium]GJQ39255.1 MAG: primosomal protein N' [Anaerolineaceae bacterium]HMM99314.1 primosomal protein N' [Anaerolineales bacterium]
MFARLAVNLPAVSGMFDYAIPDELAGQVGVGCLVTAPFGNQTVQGVVMELPDAPSVAETRPLESLLDPVPVLTAPQIELAKWMSERYLQPLAAVVGMMLPAGLSQQADVLYQLVDGRPETEDRPPSPVHDQVADRLIKLLHERGPLRGRQIDRHFAKVDWRKSADWLVKRGVLRRQSILPPPRVRPKFVRVAQLAVTPAEAEAAMPSLGAKQTLARRQAALRFLVRAVDAVNVSWVYAESGCNLADLENLEERGLIRLFESEIFRDPLERVEKRTENRGLESSEVTLTQEQEAALEEITAALTALRSPLSNNFLLHGVTGSGKTEIYIRAAQETIKREKQVIVLVPEIALTPQIVRRFLARFPGQVGLVHSKLSEGERYDTWRRAREGKLKIVIGPRSALFAPLPNIGLIVADECHDASYYQSEPPFYHAVTAAQEYARLCGAVFVMGSATPTIEQRFYSTPLRLPPFLKKMGGDGEGGLSRLLSLPQRVTDSQLPPVSIVDMRAELKSGNRGIFSRALSEALAETLSRGEQAILFLNRRGTATYVFCRDCGTTLKCPNCDTPLTYHADLRDARHPSPDALLCHRCDYTRNMPKKCAVCGSAQIRQYGLGSEKVETDVQAMFPQARTLRWDWETTRQKDAHEIILTHFANHQADILIGTQMLAKGLDLPLVTLVGIVLADVGLSLPDPFASERTFQLLTQVAGRAGRSARGGQAILQTFAPDHYVIQSAARHDVDGFQKLEAEYRRQLGYPPFGRVTRLEFRHRDGAKAESEAKRVLQIVEEKIKSERRTQTVASAVPCFFAKMDGWYRWQVLLRGPDPVSLLRGLRLDEWRVETEPISLL